MISNIYNSYRNTNLLRSYYQNNAQGKALSGAKQNDENIKASIFYVNDLHGQNIRMERLVNAVNQFDSFTPSGSDKMKFASGDIMLGEDISHVKVDNKFLNIAGFMASALGNHECDLPGPLSLHRGPSRADRMAERTVRRKGPGGASQSEPPL